MVTGEQQTGSVWRVPAIRALVAATALGFTSFAVTLSALPVQAAAGGASLSAAGLVTTVFLVVTVATQAAVPRVVARWGLGPVLAGGLLALGAPAPLYLVDDSLGWLCAVSGVRGAGFGVLTVLGSTIAARAVPVERRGEALGVYGLALGLPTLAATPGGAALALGGHVEVVALLAAAPVLGLLVVPALVRAVPVEVTAASGTPSGPAARAAAAPSAVLFVVTLASAGLVTFLPLARPDGSVATLALLAFGVLAALARWGGGVLVDRVGARVLLVPALLVAAAGLVLLGVGLGSDAVVVLGAAVFGAGYGGTQNTTLVVAMARAGDRGTTAASAVWNASFDAGTGLGALVVGLLTATLGPGWSYAVLAVAVAAMLPAAVRVTRR
ncbi:Predicted arabinose efflux permease, MFS family [Klenkia marina]|uniref:Predicted arabinose efflux permease, MFS family n=1 Tax=Klenkia marina TaxID=1960309 RepID=A0A1G4Z5A6_9ACTN|nr:MFS transporter [Klenkia marina]SCX60843.1 Predicted arabinose efflux permease, MFS family [Klenkia marina]